jgi:hypothetical protein
MENSSLLLLLQALILLIVGWIKLDIRDLWKAHNKHGHKIDCPDRDCKPRTCAVTVGEEK